MMVFINEAYKQENLPQELVEGFVKLLAPIAPHIAEELWERLGHNESIAYAEWPTYDESQLVENEIEIVVQINGKVRAKLVVPANATKEQMSELAEKDEKIQSEVSGKTIRKIIAVPGKLVNIVAN